MADNTTFQSGTLATPPAGTVISADESVTSGLMQRVKLALSADGSDTHVSADANGLEVQGAGAAGTPAGGVVSIQGVASMTAVIVNGSGVTQPVSGTFWQATQPVSGTFWQATQPVSGTVTATVATKTVKWSGSPTSRSTGLTTELNSLANAGYSAVGTAFDNTSNLDEYGACDIVLASLTPTAGAYLALYLVQSLDVTNYEDAPSSTNPGTHMLAATMLVTTGAATKRIMTPWFRIPPGKFKLVLYNSTGVSLGATSNTVTLYTSNDAWV